MILDGCDWLEYNPSSAIIKCHRCLRERRLAERINFQNKSNEAIAFIIKHKRCRGLSEWMK